MVCVWCIHFNVSGAPDDVAVTQVKTSAEIHVVILRQTCGGYAQFNQRSWRA